MILQKALSPAHVKLLVESNGDTISGFVVPAGAVLEARTPDALYQAHGLGFPGTPFDPKAEFLDVLRFQSPLSLHVHTASAPEFVDRPPFTGTGFAAWDDGVVPLYFLDEVRVPAGAELWRVRAGQEEQLIAVYLDVARGWWVPDGSDLPQPAERQTAGIIGGFGVLRGHRFPADLIRDNAVAVLSSSEKPPAEFGDWEPSRRGCWMIAVPVEQLEDFFEVDATCRWKGQPFRITASTRDQDGNRHFRVFYMGHNSDIAESLGLNKGDAGVYWSVLPESELTDIQVVQNYAKGLLPGR